MIGFFVLALCLTLLFPQLEISSQVFLPISDEIEVSVISGEVTASQFSTSLPLASQLKSYHSCCCSSNNTSSGVFGA